MRRKVEFPTEEEDASSVVVEAAEAACIGLYGLDFRFFVKSRGSPREVMKRGYAARNRSACAEFFPEFARIEGAVAGGGCGVEGGGTKCGDRGGMARQLQGAVCRMRAGVWGV